MHDSVGKNHDEVVAQLWRLRSRLSFGTVDDLPLPLLVARLLGLIIDLRLDRLCLQPVDPIRDRGMQCS